MKPSEIKRIAEAACAHGMTILEHWLPGGKREGINYVVRNPHRSDEHAGSLSINIDSGLGADFASGETFKDFVAVVAFALGADMSEAAQAVATFLRIPLGAGVPPEGSARAPKAQPRSEPKWHALQPVSPGADPPPVAHPTLGKPDHTATYRSSAGQVLGYVCRWNATSRRKKEFRPLTWCVDATGRSEWQWQTWPLPRPLYGLDLLAKRPAAVVILHEGEKATEAARTLLPDYVSTCWPNGAASADKADFGPLAGRTVLLWADHDAPGTKAMLLAARALKKTGAKSVKFLNLSLFAKHTVNSQGSIIDRLDELPSGWDAADAMYEGWRSQALGELLARDDALVDNMGPGEPGDECADGQEPATPGGASKKIKRFGPYLFDPDRGLFWIETKDGEDVEQAVCGPLLVPSLGSNGEGEDYGPVLEFIDRDGRQRREIIPYKLLIGQGFDGLKLLADCGLEIAPNLRALERLRNYIVGAKPHKRARFFSQTGWYERVFRLPDCTIGETDDIHIFRGNRKAQGIYSSKGKHAEWQSHIAHPAVGNPLLMFCISLGFAGPLLKPLSQQGMAFHIVGDSSIGKSGALCAAGSVWGSTEAQVHSWRTTDNAVEYTAAQHNHGLLILDELREVDPKAAGAIVYMLTNARGKGRAHHAGGLREATTWSIAMLSSGEIGLSDHLASAGQKHFAGQEVRFIEIEGDAGAGFGMWADVGAGVGGGKQFTDSLKKFATRYFGTAGRAFLTELVKDTNLDQLPAWWRSQQTAFAETYKPQDAGGQVLRVMTAFCLAGFAGELAARFGVVTWTKGAAMSAAGQLFTKWQKARPAGGNSEEYKIIKHVLGLMQRTWQSRFIDWDRSSGTQRVVGHGVVGDYEPDLSRMPAVQDALGFRKPDIPFDKDNPQYLFYVSRTRFEDEFASKAGFKHKRVAALLMRHGVLRCDSGSTTWREFLPNGDPRSYCLIGQKLWALHREPGDL
jgi:uncharacterized protein (DUF927 family)